jgi:hypothetical protein
VGRALLLLRAAILALQLLGIAMASVPVWLAGY